MITWFIIAYGILAIVSVIASVLGAFVLYVAVRRGEYSAGRAFGAAVGLTLFVPAVVVMTAAAIRWALPANYVFLLLAPSLIVLVVPLVWGRVTLSKSWGKSILAGVGWLTGTLTFISAVFGLLLFFTFEAFVVPTGGMMPTVLGYHRDIVCPQCAFPFSFNASMETEPQPGFPPALTTSCTCPNCRHDIEFDRENQSNPKRPIPAIHGGERVLTTKGLLGPTSYPPERLDCVVFIYPESQSKGKGAYKYIQRLVGMPGETVAIGDGELYVRPADKSPQPLASANAPAAELWKQENMHAESVEGGSAALQAKGFALVRKTPERIMAARRIVHDNDFSSTEMKDHPRWAADLQDFTRDGAAFTAKKTEGNKTAWLHYEHRLRGSEDVKQLITDFEGYNTAASKNMPPRIGDNWVGDLMLECEVAFDKAEGELTLELSKGVERFQVIFNLADAGCTLVRLADGERTEWADQGFKLKPGVRQLRFANIDEQCVVWVDDMPLSIVTRPYTPPAARGPTANDLEPASVGVKNAAVTVRHLKLWRDTYHTTGRNGVFNADHEGAVDLSNPERWEPLRTRPARTFYVQPGHYFVIGDNSSYSSDSRSWGLVPDRLLLGKALLVYYPFGRGRWLR